MQLTFRWHFNGHYRSHELLSPPRIFLAGKKQLFRQLLLISVIFGLQIIGKLRTKV